MSACQLAQRITVPKCTITGMLACRMLILFISFFGALTIKNEINCVDVEATKKEKEKIKDRNPWQIKAQLSTWVFATRGN